MELLGFLVALCMAVMAVLLICYLLFLLLMPLRDLIRDGREAARVRTASRRLEQVDTLISQGKTGLALKALRRAVVYDATGSEAIVESLKEHHQNLLSRVLVLAEEVGGRPTNIADVERLLLERAELQKLLLKALDSFRSLRFRRERAGKNLPDWSKSDFDGRITEIRKELSRNQEFLEKALDQLFKNIEGSASEQIFYH